MRDEVGDQGVEQRIESALRSRFQHFKDQANSLTLGSVRRLLEKDLGLQKFTLDAHKRFIKDYLEKLMDGADDCNLKPSNETVDDDADFMKEATILALQENTKKSPKGTGNGDEEMTEESPIMGVLTPKPEASPQVSSVSQNRIQKAISKRADHFLANSEVLTLAGVRRLLEEDLALSKNTLDPFKKFISQQIDQVLNPTKGAKSSHGVRKKASGSVQTKKLEKSREEGYDTSSSESKEMEDKVDPRKETALRSKIKTPQRRKNRKRTKDSSLDDSDKKQKRQKEENSDSDNPGSLSEDGQSQSSVRKSAQTEKAATVFGKKVEHLKSIIKACGMSVAPTIYKKAKQVPDNKRDTFLVEELEGILSREGLSKYPSEKEIKDCKKRKETARELEGIDTSNILLSSRRRSTLSFVAPPKPEIRAKAKKVNEKDDKSKESNVKEHDDDNEEEKNEEEEEEEEEEEDDDESGEDEDEEFDDDDNKESD